LVAYGARALLWAPEGSREQLGVGLWSGGPLERWASARAALWPRELASLSEWAGSVLTMRVDSPESARRTAMELDVLVLPTPPLPPTKISRCATVLGCSRVESPAG